MTESNF